jgi:hypothetical protein
MAMRPMKNSPLLRLMAAAWLVVWITAHAMFVGHCTGLGSAKKGGHDCCTASQSGSSKTSESGAKSLCGELKLATLEKKSALDEPVAFVAAVPLPLIPSLLAEIPADSSTAAFLRTAPRSDFVFRPEVCLGAALRSLAPPSLA